MAKFGGTSSSFQVFDDENTVCHSAETQLTKLTKFPCRGGSKKSEPPKRTPETMKFSSEVPPAPMKPRRTTKKVIATPKRLEYPEAEDENAETPKTPMLCPGKPEVQRRYPTRATSAAQASKPMAPNRPSSSKAKPAKSRNKKNQDNLDKENDSGAANRQELNSKKNRLQKNTVNQQTSQSLAMPEESNNDKTTKIPGDQFSICSSSDPLDRLRWLHKRRDIGIWIECCRSKCKKWRYTDEYHDPVDVPKKWYCEMNTDPNFTDCSIPEQKVSREEAKHQIYNIYNAGSIVWARMNGFPWWPAMVDDCPKALRYFKLKRKSRIPSMYHVIFFNDIVETAWLAPRNLKSYKDNPRNTFIKKTVYKRKDYAEDLNIPCEQADEALLLSIYERLQKFSFVSRNTNNAPDPHKNNCKEKRDASVVPEELQPLTKKILTIRSRTINGDTDTAISYPSSSKRFAAMEKVGMDVDQPSSSRRSRSMTRRADESSNYEREESFGQSDKDILRPPLAPLSTTSLQRPVINIKKPGKNMKKASASVTSKTVSLFDPQPSTSKSSMNSKRSSIIVDPPSGYLQRNNLSRQNETMDITDEESGTATDSQCIGESVTNISSAIADSFVDSGIEVSQMSSMNYQLPNRAIQINGQSVPSQLTEWNSTKSSVTVDPPSNNATSRQNGVPEIIDLTNDDEPLPEPLTLEQMEKIFRDQCKEEALNQAAVFSEQVANACNSGEIVGHTVPTVSSPNQPIFHQPQNRMRAVGPRSYFPETAEFVQLFEPRGTPVNFPSGTRRSQEFEDVVEDYETSCDNSDSLRLMDEYIDSFGAYESDGSLRNGSDETIGLSLPSLEMQLSTSSQTREFVRSRITSWESEISPLSTTSEVSPILSPIPMEIDENYSDGQQFELEVEMAEIMELEHSRSPSRSMSFGSEESSIVPSSRPSQDSRHERLPKFPGLVLSRVPSERCSASLEVLSRSSSIEIITVVD